MGTVLLEGMEFFGYHGMYPEEHVLGNRFLINLELDTDFESRQGRTLQEIWKRLGA